MGGFFAGLFYAVMLGAVVFFVHKVLWFLRYRRLQEKLVTQALSRLTEEADTTLVRWDQGADASWSETTTEDGTPSDYVRRVERKLASLEAQLNESRTPIGDALIAHISEEREAERICLLRIPRLEGETTHVEVALGFAKIEEPPVPDESEFELELRSRYGFSRRALAFFLGAADVVYSSQHVTRMAQNPKVPFSVLFRRLSLVFLILLALAVDIGFGIRAKLVLWCETWVPQMLHLEAGSLADLAAPTVAMGIWLGAYGTLYLGLYFFLRWRSGRHLARLEDLRETFSERVAEEREHQLEALHQWARNYAATLDNASMLTLHQAQMLIQRSSHRLRRRIASPRLLALSAEVSHCFFERLPESAQNLQDIATEQKHSFGHLLWPQAKEMAYQIEIAQYRHAWRDIELCLSQLRGQHPDPELAGQLWRSLVRYARMFPTVVPENLFTRLQEAHGDVVATIVDETDSDLDDLDARLEELGVALCRTVDSSGPLIESRIELTERSLRAAVAELVSEALEVRERARLEAMAFEI